MLRTVRVLVLVLWPTVWVWTLPGQHRPGSGLVLAWLLVGVYSASAVLLLGSGQRMAKVLPVCIPLFTLAAAIGAMTGPDRHIALLVPLFLGVLCVIAAMQFSPRATWAQAGVASVAAMVCVWWAAPDPVQVAVTSVAVLAGIAAPPWAILRLRSQLDAAHAREHRLARTDPLTGALNRRGLFEAAASVLEAAPEVDVVTLDLDGFKRLNDTHGHAVGDEALRAVAASLRALEDSWTAPGPLLVARLGGEEFLVLAPAAAHPVDELAEAVRAAAAVPVSGGERTSASVGAIRRRPPAEPEERTAWLLRQIDVTDELMYRAKRSGGDRVLAEHP
ncbi:diguanylate cyclase domain-containing protein [Aquipuribacter sp. MA13-6]|uniref:GGDEF domain-containing protein n=1 Tax=unclassified Aquipuribacter TaxID=2635084 RepID=UPI003EEEC7E0